MKIGDLFEIDTNKGKCYFQYVFDRANIGQLIRVLPGVFTERPSSLEDIAKQSELYFIHFPLKAAYKKKIILMVGNYKIPESVELPKEFRSASRIKIGGPLSWDIVDYATLKRRKLSDLSDNQKKLSEWGVWNDTLLIERLEEGWTLDKWV